MRLIAVGVIVAAISGFFAIGFLLKFLQKQSTMVFIIYRFALGISILLLIVTGIK
jgi:undecaprenyl-diphosphatase